MIKKTIACTIIALSGIFSASADMDNGTIFGDLQADGFISTMSGRIMRVDATGKTTWFRKTKNCHDIWLLDNGNILFADSVVLEINPATNEEVFRYQPEYEKGVGGLACQRLENGNTLIGENSTGRILEVNAAGEIVFQLQVEPITLGDHANLRMVRKLENGNYLACLAHAKLVREYTPAGEIVFEVAAQNLAFSAVRLPNGNTIVGDINVVTEFDSTGEKVWELQKSDLPDVNLGMICGVNVLPNGNLILGIYKADMSDQGAGSIEITKDKKVVWRYVNGITTKTEMMSVQKIKCGKAISNLR
jgi:hypothetical protein